MSTTTPDGFTSAGMKWDQDMTVVPAKVAGARRVGLRLARRLRTPRGHCTGHPNDGTDISDSLESTLDAKGATNLRAAIQAEMLKDPSVTKADVTVSLTLGGSVNNISIQAFGAFGQTNVNITQASDGTYTTTAS